MDTRSSRPTSGRNGELAQASSHPEIRGSLSNAKQKFKRTSSTDVKFTVLKLFDVLSVALSRGGPGTEHLSSQLDAATPIEEYAKYVGLKQVKVCRKKKLIMWKAPGNTGVFLDACKFTRAYLEVLIDSDEKLLGFPHESLMVIFQEALSWKASEFVKHAKYCLAYPMAKYMNNDLPPIPKTFKSNPLFKGALKRYLKSRIVSKSTKNTQVFWNILQGVKRGCSTVDETFLKKGLEDHSAGLGAQPLNDYVNCREKYAEIFSSMPACRPTLNGVDPTTSASFEQNRSNGGGYGYLKGNLFENKLDLEYGLIKMVEIDRKSDTSQVENRTGIKDFHGCVSTLGWFDTKALLAPEGFERCVHTSALAEPLKVRVVTKGPAARSWLSAFAQRAPWQHLGRFNCFDLTKGVMREEHLKLLESNSFYRNPEFDFWVSGDYSAATDGIDIRQTKDALRAFTDHQQLICPTWTPEVTEVLESELLEQKIHYKDFEPVQQQNGQLMGSKLSFPFLCIINMVAYWNSLERYHGRDVLIDELDDLLVNGDDILFKSNPRHYDCWKQSIKEVGLTLSVGKNYIHKQLLTVNSELWERKPTGFRKYHYLSCSALFAGPNSERKEIASGPIWDHYNWMMLGSLNKERLHRRFIHYHIDEIRKVTSNGLFNLCLPAERGGLSFDQHVPFTITDFQRKFATALWRSTCGSPEALKKRCLISDDPADVPLHRAKQYQFWQSNECLKNSILDPKDRKVRLKAPFSKTLVDDNLMKYRGPDSQVLRWLRKNPEVHPMCDTDICQFPYRITTQCELSKPSALLLAC
jgi:hypothetical protein